MTNGAGSHDDKKKATDKKGKAKDARASLKRKGWLASGLDKGKTH